ncbi:parallel beta-helix repeat (two copies) [Noviherbaspirillum humi]|uniref:Parallel beta-helix repeat (Two copies) n=2 Tax=Noviherbaspirillum humi TaxID=1688639 RepID=A0A239LCJ1_9BURK|nr:parallel beta-helix repeat (two copies) [Noviherbaspirillum humi]
MVPVALRTLYVSPTGSDGNSGLSETEAFKTIQRAHDLSQPGDQVLVMNGTYNFANVTTIKRSGNASAWISYKAYPGHTPVMNVGTNSWGGFTVAGASYILIEGFTLVGSKDSITYAYAYSERNNLNNPATSANGILINAQYSTPSPHHIVVRKNTVRKFGGGCIGTLYADYITIEDNDVSECGWWSPYGNSGISMYENVDADGDTGQKMIVRRNRVYSNWNYIPFYAVDAVTDGNGIIVDDGRHTQMPDPRFTVAYKGRTLIENNIVFNNGGRGIHIYESDNVTVRNNVSYRNSNHPGITNGEITPLSVSNVQAYGNVMVPRSDRPANGSSNTSDVVFSYNIVSGGTGFNTFGGTGNLINVDPKFIDAANYDFRLAADSPAVDIVPFGVSAAYDFVGKPRNANADAGAAADAGAYEVVK